MRTIKGIKANSLTQFVSHCNTITTKQAIYRIPSKTPIRSDVFDK